MPRDKFYFGELKEWIATAIDGGIVGFGDLVSNLHGAFPSDVLDALRELAISDDRCRAILSQHEIRDSSESKLDVRGPGWLPVPHPLDFDWRFSSDTAMRLLDIALSERLEPSRISLLGAPSLVPGLVNRVPRCGKALYDSNPLIADAVRSHFPDVHCVTVDLCAESLDAYGNSDLVVADPPWYLRHMKAFLRSASRVCKVGGLIVTSCPPKGTRPNIKSERDQLLGYCRELGLQERRVCEGALRYDSPYFEANAIRAAQIGHVPIDWRTGDLLILQRQAENVLPDTKWFRREIWTEVNIDGVRIKVRKKDCRSNDFRLESLVRGDILNTVSQRDPRLSKVDVWTMGNRVFACESTHLFLQLAQELGRHSVMLSSEFLGSPYLDAALDQLRMIVCAETART